VCLLTLTKGIVVHLHLASRSRRSASAAIARAMEAHGFDFEGLQARHAEFDATNAHRLGSLEQPDQLGRIGGHVPEHTPSCQPERRNLD
jgi:hypothetical protein